MAECEQFNEYVAWYGDVVFPRLRDFFNHVKHCEACMEKVKASQGAADALGLKFLTTPIEKLIEET